MWKKIAVILPIVSTVHPATGNAKENSDDAAEIENALKQDAEATSAASSSEISAGSATQTLNPDISLVLDVAAAYFNRHENEQDGEHDPTENGFNLQQLEMSIGQSVDPYFRFDSYLLFRQSEVEIEEAYATTLALPYNLQLRVGQFLTRFGRLNGTHPHVWDFVDQPFALSRIFGGDGNRGLGTEVSYLTPLPWFAELTVSATDANGETTARSFYGPTKGQVNSPLDVQWTAALKQFHPLSPNWSVFWGLALATGPNATGDETRSNVYGGDLYLKYKPVTFESFTSISLQTEWFYRRRQLPNTLLSDVAGYAYLQWRFAQRWGIASRYEYGSPTRNRAGQKEVNDLDPEWTQNRHKVSANLTFWPTEFSRLRLQASRDDATWLTDPILAAFLAFEVTIGPHAAHKF